MKDFQNIQTIKNWVGNCFLGDFIIFLSEYSLARTSLIMVHKCTSEEHVLSLEFHLVQSVLYFIEVLCRRKSPFVFIFNAFFILARCLLVGCTEEFLLVCSTFSESILIIVFSISISLRKLL